MNVRIFGKESVIRLSQYIGDFHPDAHVKGWFGCNLTALICNKNSATFSALSLFNIMWQMYKVFIENRAVEFVNSQKIETNLSSIEASLIQSIEEDLKEKLMSLDSNACFYVRCIDRQKEWERLFRNHQFVHAAGGAVQKNHEFLVIKRFGMLDLPKGHLDVNERSEIAAEREIREECGIFPLVRKEFICSTYHTYFYNDHPVLKQTDWYLFDYLGTDKGEPQTEEGIEEVIWMPFREINLQKDSFYTSVQYVLDETIKKIDG